jgi:pSer/pThr/pTyr-binding forkhead associated (FHA) protein
MPYLTLVEKGSERSHRVDGTEVLAGRDPACGIYLEGDEAKTVSGRHARFFLDDAKWYVEDAGSRNGTYIGGRTLEAGARHALAIGDVIGLGLTGTQLSVREAVGRALAATMLEAAPPPLARPAVGGAEPMRMSDAIRAGNHDLGAGEQVRVVLRGVQNGLRIAGQGDRVTIGRALECLIRVEGESATSVSRVHSEVAVINGQLSLRDGGSRHGTFLNARKIDGATPIKQGDVIMLGPGGPNFTVDELGIVPAASPGSLPTIAAPAREPSVGPTGVRPAASKGGQTSAVRDDDPGYRAYSAAQPTPLDQPAFRGLTPEKDQAAFRKPTPPQPQPARRKPTPQDSGLGQATKPAVASRKVGTAVWAIVIVLAVVTAATLYFAK